MSKTAEDKYSDIKLTETIIRWIFYRDYSKSKWL